MILNVSGRTDIVAFYTKWFINRYKEGYVDVRNPYYPKNISRIYFKDVDAIVFCTKNPTPILKYLKLINKPIIFHITITAYHKDIEPNVENKNNIINSIKKLSKIIDKEYIYIRYDPIFINNKYNINYHIKAFNKLCNLLNGYVKHIIISFLDEYKNVKKNYKYLNYQKIDIPKIAKNFSKIAKKNNMTIQTCAEEELKEYGFILNACVSEQLAYKITGKKYKKWKSRPCNCVELVDIGVYNTCRHFCKYCYANYDEKQVEENIKKHDISSSLLIGKIEKDDIIKIRK